MYLKIKYGWHDRRNAFCHGDDLDSDIEEVLSGYGFSLVTSEDDLKKGERNLLFESEELIEGPSNVSA